MSHPRLEPLFTAIKRGDRAEIIRQAELVAADGVGVDWTACLWEAVRSGQEGILELLLGYGVDLARVDARADTLLHVAAFSGHTGIVRFLLAHGCDPDVRNYLTGATPLIRALLASDGRAHEVLLEAGADPNLATINRDTPLHVAAKTNAGAAILALLERGADPMARNASGRTFQSYYFSAPGHLITDDARYERIRVKDWLRAHDIPLEVP